MMYIKHFIIGLQYIQTEVAQKYPKSSIKEQQFCRITLRMM
jgi:hypothetical protein